MDDSLIRIALIVLTLAAGLNLFLTLRLAAIVRPDLWAAPLTVPIGEPVPPFEGRRRSDGASLVSADLAGRPIVLAFLSPACPACAGAAAALAAALPAIEETGIALWIVPADAAHDIALLPGAAPLLGHVLELDGPSRRRLNPRRQAPFYLFLDERLIVQASNLIGDEDWQAFLAQMAESGAAGAAPLTTP
jgi:hypothetical protein